mgnify:CR=1 FL=1
MVAGLLYNLDSEIAYGRGHDGADGAEEDDRDPDDDVTRNVDEPRAVEKVSLAPFKRAAGTSNMHTRAHGTHGRISLRAEQDGARVFPRVVRCAYTAPPTGPSMLEMLSRG